MIITQEITVYVLILFTVQGAVFCNNNSVLDKLYTELLSDYNKILPPVKSLSSPVNISVYFIVYELIRVSEVENLIVLAGSTELYWQDDFLNWDPTSFGGVEQIFLPADQIWTPRLALFNVSGGDGILKLGGEAEVKSDGKVEMQIPFYFNALCSVQVRYFPFDKQLCKIHFGNVHRYSSDVLVDAKVKNVDISQITTNQEWTVLNSALHQRIAAIPDKPGKNYVYLELSIEIERKPLFFIYTLIIPSFVIAFISLCALFSPYNSKVQGVL